MKFFLRLKKPLEKQQNRFQFLFLVRFIVKDWEFSLEPSCNNGTGTRRNPSLADLRKLLLLEYIVLTPNKYSNNWATFTSSEVKND